MKRSFLTALCAFLCAFCFAVPARAIIMIDFENVPADYVGLWGKNLYDYYDGVTFGNLFGYGGVTVDDPTFAIPAPSGTGVAFPWRESWETGIFATFDLPADYVGFWYYGGPLLTGPATGRLRAYDSSGNLLGTVVGEAVSEWEFLEFKWPGYEISQVFIDSSLMLEPYPLIDDFQFNPVPEPATMLLLGSGLIGVAAFRRKFKKS